MNGLKLTQNSQTALTNAEQLAQKLKHSELNNLHLLRSILVLPDSIAVSILEGIEVSVANLLSQVDQQLHKLPQVSNPAGQLPLGRDLKKLLPTAAQLATDFGDDYISIEHLLLAMASDGGDSEKLLTNAGVTKKAITGLITKIRGGQKVTDPNPEGKYQAIKKYSQNFTKLAREGKLDPVIGRDEEIRRIMQVLSRRTKNNPVLIGEPGVGKTAIVEGLAQRIVDKDVPDNLLDKEVISLDLAAMLAGAKFRGEFEDRLKAFLKAVAKEPDKYIIFIDELHTLVGAGGAEGAVDASNMLKPALARGELRAVGATTLAEYRKYVEKDAALERRFQPVYVEEPSLEDAVAILRGIKEKYEVHHGIRITDDAILSAVRLSQRYIPDRFLPDKAIDLIDEAASGIKIESQSQPEALDKLNRKIIQLEIELQAMKREKSATAKARRLSLTKELADLKEEAKTLKIKWQAQKKILDALHSDRSKLEEAKSELESAEREVDLEKAAKIKYGTIPEIQKNIKATESKWLNIDPDDRIIREEVSEEDIAIIVSRWTGIPTTKLLSTESEKLAQLEKNLHQRVVGQDKAIREIANAIRRSRTGLNEPNKPIGSFLFLGPTGVGKTELSKALAEFLFNDENAMVRIDMSEYLESHSVARLIGAPPGYVGYDEGGQLTEAVRRRPFCVVLLDETEKAHPQVFNTLLQVLDEGRLTDGRGRTVNFKNTIIILTSNIGSSVISQYANKLSSDAKFKQEMTEQVMARVKSTFRPEFINRLDQIIIFEPLTRAQMGKIVEIQLRKLSQRLDQQGLKLKADEASISLLAKLGYDPAYGARPLMRVIQNQILDKLALDLVENKIKTGDTIKLSVQADKLQLTT